MITAGVAMLGFVFHKFFAAFGKVRVPLPMNIFCAVAFGLIAAGVQSA